MAGWSLPRSIRHSRRLAMPGASYRSGSDHTRRSFTTSKPRAMMAASARSRPRRYILYFPLLARPDALSRPPCCSKGPRLLLRASVNTSPCPRAAFPARRHFFFLLVLLVELVVSDFGKSVYHI